MGGKQSNWATGMGVNCIMANELTTPMEPSGRVLPLFRGEYSDSIVYENPDIVLYENSSYVAKQITIGNPPPKNVSSNDYWQMVAKGIIDADVSDSTIEFTEASERINIKSGEKSNIIMGKIMKFFTDLKDVAFSGSYVDLSNKPTIPASAKNGKLTIQKNGTEVQTFTANQSTNAVANILVPTISNSAAVTQTGQMALDAVEKNAAVPGTLANQISQANSNIDAKADKDRWVQGTITERGVTVLFKISYHSAWLLVGWVLAGGGASTPTVCIAVDGATGDSCKVSTILSGTSVTFALAEDGKTIQFNNPYGNVCFWHAIRV